MSFTFSPVPLTRLHLDTAAVSLSTVRVVVAGEVDLATASQFRERLLGVLRDRAPAVLVVDLAEVTFLDCAGIGALVAARNTAVHAGRRLWITNPQPVVRRVLALAGLLGVLTDSMYSPMPADSDAPPQAGRRNAVVAAPSGVMVAA